MSIWQELNEYATRDLERSLGALSSAYNSPQLEVNLDALPHPLSFLYYSKIVDSGGDKKAILDFLFTLRLKIGKYPKIISYGSGEFLKEEWEEINASFASESTFPKKLIPPDDKSIFSCNNFLCKTLQHLKFYTPEYFDLITSLVSTVVLAKPEPHSPAIFGGATYFFFWGGVVLNSDIVEGSFCSFLEQLLHESLHMALFAICSKYGALCTNPDTEAYNSAFRTDRRPMHGLLHAYFVASNLSSCFLELSLQDSFNSNQFKELSERALKSSNKLFDEITENAKLTPLGESILHIPGIINSDFLK
jgi:hypothetical protein